MKEGLGELPDLVVPSNRIESVLLTLYGEPDSVDPIIYEEQGIEVDDRVIRIDNREFTVDSVENIEDGARLVGERESIELTY